MLTLFLTLALFPADPAQDEAQKLQGTWAAYNAEAEGVPVPREHIARSGLRVQGDKWTMLLDGRPVGDGTFTVNPGADPKTLDVIGPRKQVMLKAIYKLEGNTLTVCYALK